MGTIWAAVRVTARVQAVSALSQLMQRNSAAATSGALGFRAVMPPPPAAPAGFRRSIGLPQLGGGRSGQEQAQTQQNGQKSVPAAAFYRGDDDLGCGFLLHWRVCPGGLDPKQIVEGDGEQLTHGDELIHIGHGAVHLPTGHRLPGHAQPGAQLLLREVLLFAQLLDALA